MQQRKRCVTAGIYLKVRETITEGMREQIINLIRETDRHRFNQSFYSDGLIKSFKTLATRKRDGIITVTAAVTVWTDIDKKKYIHPRLRANVSVKMRFIRKIFCLCRRYCKIRRIGTY